MSVTLVTGATGSGKSEFAEALALGAGNPVVYVATASLDARDAEWAARIALHRLRRPAQWGLIETAGERCELDAVVRGGRAGTVLLIDSLGTWIADRMAVAHAEILDDRVRLEAALAIDEGALLAALRTSPATVIVVSDEVGWGIVPPHPGARIFRDVLGGMHRRLTDLAEHAYLVIHGRALDIKGLSAPRRAFSQEVRTMPTPGAPEDYAREIAPANAAIAALARARVDALTKPVGALGRIESLAIQLCAIAGTLEIETDPRKAVLVAAGDHGVNAEGVSAYPAEVSGQMVAAFTGGHAAINAFSRAVRADFYVVDFGVRERPEPHASLLDFRVGAGTANFAREPAMTFEQSGTAIAYGIAAFHHLMERRRYDVVALGEMGIGNTTSAAAMIGALTGATAADVVGRGTGIDDTVFARKIAVVDAALQRFAARDWRSIACEVGGFEIVGLAGVILAAARHRIPIVLDGFIVAAAALLAYRIAPATRDYCIAGHLSQERGHRIALEALGLRPLLDLELRLGEGTGAALALPLLEAASRMIREMKTFGEAGVAVAD